MDPKERRRSVRHDLRRWGGVARFCASKQREISEIRTMLAGAVSLKSPSFDGMPHGSSVTRPTERSAEMLERLEQCYESRIEELTTSISDELSFARTIDSAVATLEPKEQKVLELMYKEQYNAFKLSRIMNYDVATIWRIENRACDVIDAFLKDATKCDS